MAASDKDDGEGNQSDDIAGDQEQRIDDDPFDNNEKDDDSPSENMGTVFIDEMLPGSKMEFLTNKGVIQYDK